MLWKRSRADATDPGHTAVDSSTTDRYAPPDAPRDTSQEDAAIDTVVSLLRTLGRSSLGVGDANQTELGRVFELWAGHLAIGGPHPDAQFALGTDDRAALPTERDWVGARRFVQARREQECEQVAATI